jgi:hypothetical protein
MAISKMKSMDKTRRMTFLNAEWSDLNKKMQVLIKRKETFPAAIDILLALRKNLLHWRLL